MEFKEVIGFMAGILTTASFVPQVVKTVVLKSTREISGGMYGMLFVGVVLWFSYGLMLMSWPTIISNGVSLILLGTMVAFKLIYK